jgi:hypothetical protein
MSSGKRVSGIRTTFGWLVTGQVALSRALRPRAAQHSVSKAVAPVLTSEEATVLVANMHAPTTVGPSESGFQRRKKLDFKIKIALIAGGFTLVGTLLGAFITYWFALRLAKTNARREAGRRLRDAFQPELTALNPVTGRKDLHIESVLQYARPRHNAAVLELQFHLPPEERASLQAAWRKYYEVGGSIHFYDYMLTGQNNVEPWEVF